MTATRRDGWSRRWWLSCLIAACAAAVSFTPARLSAQKNAAPACERCHGELELLRQQAGSLKRAEELLVPYSTVTGSAHGGMTCAECHGGYSRFPHDTRATRTSTCESCHAPADSAWRVGPHASADEPVRCVQCHESHAVRAADALKARHGAQAANAPCKSCHESARIERHIAHGDSVACSSCHGPHDVRPVDDPQSWMAPANQQRTCGTCHDSVAIVWRGDVHAATAGAHRPDSVIVCTSCHLGHRMLPRGDPGFAGESVTACVSCHEHAGRTYFASYHGKAAALGSKVAATCSACHGAHDIQPDSVAGSRVAAASLIATCKGCHEYARAAFVKYDAHPDVFNRARNPWIFYAFWFMNGLLIFVLLVFGAHTLLWWRRIRIDQRRAGAAGLEGGT